MRVSVVVPTYNRANMIERALESVRAQLMPDTELIVIDDGSTDGTESLLRSREDLVYLRIPHVGVVGAVRNTGIERASGGAVAFLDSDDVWLPGKLARQIAALRADERAVMSSSNAYVRDDESGDGRLYLPDLVQDCYLGFEDLIARNSVVASTAVVRTESLRAVRGFSTSPLLRGIEDYDLWLRLMAGHEHAAYLGAPLALYRDEPSSSIRGQRSRVEELLGLLVIMRRACELLDSGDQRLHAAEQRCSAYVAELAFHQWASAPSRVKRILSRLGRGAHLPRLRFGYGHTAGWLTVAPRAGVGTRRADAYIDPGELWLPPRSVSGVAIDLDQDLTVSDVVGLAAGVRPWLAPGAVLQIVAGPAALPASWSGALQDAGFVYRRGSGDCLQFVASGS
jgi:hypothetical protein